MNKIIAMLLALSMVLAFTACAKTETAPETTAAPVETAAVETEAPVETEAAEAEAVADDGAIVAAIIAAISVHTGKAPDGFRVVSFKKRK